MAKSSIHFENVKITSQSHNLRLREFDYVRKDLSHLNESFGDMTPHPEVIENFKKLIKEKTGRTAQAKAKFLIEGVFLFTENHTNEELVKVAEKFGNNFRVKIKELHIHRDEGHWDKKNNIWKPNLHAHIVVENINKETGKSIKWNKEDLSGIQDYFANSLQMERGVKSEKKHLSALEYKVTKELEELEVILNQQFSIENKDYLLVQGIILKDFLQQEITIEMKQKLLKFIENHKLKNIYYEKKKQVESIFQKTKGNKKRL